MNTTVSLPHNDTSAVWKALTIVFTSLTGCLALVLIIVTYCWIKKNCNTQQVHTAEITDHGEETFTSKKIRALKHKNKKYRNQVSRYENKISQTEIIKGLTDENFELKMAIQKLRKNHKEQKLRLNMARQTCIEQINLNDNVCKRPEVDETRLNDVTGTSVNKSDFVINDSVIGNNKIPEFENSCKSSSSINPHERNDRFLTNVQSEDMNILDKKVTVERNNSGASQFVSVRAGSDDVITEEQEECKSIKDDVQSENEERKSIKTKKKRRPTLKSTFQIHPT